jgi:hypothetical protein
MPVDAAAIGLAYAVGNIAGSFAVGALRDATGGVNAGLYLLAGVQALGSIWVLWATRRSG